MITPMTKYSFIVPEGDKDQFLSKLQELGVVDIARSSKPVDEHSSELFGKIEEAKEEIRTLEKGEDAIIVSLKAGKRRLQENIIASEIWGEFSREEIDRLVEIVKSI